MARYELTGSERANGSFHITCEALPGFHYILMPEDNIETTLKPAFMEFLALHEAGRIRNTRTTLRSRPGVRGFAAEFEFA